MLRQTIESEDSESITLRNDVAIEIHTASFRAVRGYTIIAALLDELAFWPTTDDAADPDVEVINAVRPGMATIPGAIMLCASSPYASRGALWDSHRKHFGKDDASVLVWQADTRSMNATVPQRVIDEMTEADPARAAAEYGAQFRSDVEAFINREVVNACISTGTYERAPVSGSSYKAFLDFASGSGGDSIGLAVGRKDGEVVVVDALREIRPPFSPDFAIGQLVNLLKGYKVYTVEGDNFGGEFAREPLKKHSISYVLGKKPKSDLYAHHLLPFLNSGRIDLLDHPRANAQIIGLEVRTARAGRDKIDHPPGGHDDLANCIAGLVARIAANTYNWDWVSGPAPDSSGPPRTSHFTTGFPVVCTP
jgi:hypothetical protein